MKKNYILLSGLIVASSLGFAQDKISQQVLDAERLALPNNENTVATPELLKNSRSAKAYGDTLFYEDFNGGLSGWTAVNNNTQNNNIWEWNTFYRTGDYSGNTTAIKSTTAANGFMSLPADFYNSPIPAGGAVPMDTYFESPTINIAAGNNSVYVSYQQYLRYCCSGGDSLILQVSTNNFLNFTSFDATNDIAVNASNTTNAVGGQTNVINISCALQGATSFKMRFYSQGNTHYFWMIDDIAVIEGAHNDLELQDPYMEFHEANYTYYPFYGEIPYEVFPPLPFFGRIKNNGDNTATNASMDVFVDLVGSGSAYTTSAMVGPSGNMLGAYLVPCDSVTPVLTPNPRFVPTALGDYQVNWVVTSDSVDQNLGNEVASQSFSVGDTVFSRDDGTFGGGTGPANYVDGTNRIPGGTTVGDRFATMYIIEKSPRITQAMTAPTSITYRVSSNPENIGVEITPKIWAYDEDSLSVSLDAAIGPEVAGSFFPYTVTAADTNTFLTLPLNTGTAVTNGFDNGQYAVGWEVTNLPAGTTFEVLNDASSAALQVPVSTFLYLGHAPADGWGWVRVNPGIRLNMGNLPLNTSLDKPTPSNVQFAVSPNPNNGEFKLNVSTTSNTTFNLNVRNMLGQSVYTEVVNVNGKMTKQLDLTSFEKGVYFVSLENENEKLVEKVILK